ncbi:GH92 family glycosyl hydrolase [Carboxylicivirga linearis]|uniref:GH92 family glycosyl hydrolase n=1 Tax=Carboxylicivirga linearis TaxID=1628157 RepID=A0ABS5K0W1_9BACT|nr:GH92 family glycosyl hydrolase [Carboxylicivirga linearis]MBS2100748.1 GH92 family glycosyl hydrolase [Carboxylicivirga linearis]
MIKIYTAIIISLLLWSCSNKQPAGNNDASILNYVNPFMGTDGPGNTYPGAQYPFGAVQLSPDHGLSGWDRISGYSYPDTVISGFSHMHLSGTGAGDLYDLLFMPINKRSSRTLNENGNRHFSVFSHINEGASPGYYWVLLQDFGIKAEMTASARGGVQRYHFPADTGKAVILDLGYALNWDGPTDTYIKVVDNQTLVGYRKSSGWAADQRVYFKAEFSLPFSGYQLFEEDKKVKLEAKAKHTKIRVNFDSNKEEVIEIKVALASSNIEGAEANFAAELANKDFAAIKAESEQAWTKELSKINVESRDDELKRTFYTTLYQTMLNPRIYSDVNGYYKAPNGKVEKAEGYTRYELFSLWDTFRAAHPLYTIMHPSRVQDIVKSFMAHYRETGLLPVWSLEGNETNMMIGYHAVPVIVDAYLKGLLLDCDANELYEACKASAMQDGKRIDEYKARGFVSADKKHENWSVSLTLEYAYNDWCIAQLAKDLDKVEDYQYFKKRSENWANHYDGESSFLRTIEADGSFIKHFIPKEYTDDYCESNAWQYFWFVPHNIQGLINQLGSSQRFEEKLDSMFNYYPEEDDQLPIFSTGMIGQYAHGNEPSHHVGYLYNYIGKPWKTQAIVRQIAESQYSPTPNGHCGNEDCGQMSAWFVYSALGFYPVNPADGIYVIGTPMLDKASIKLENGKQFAVIAENLSKENKYIQEAFLNGKPLKESYIQHQEIMKGGELIFKMGSEPNIYLWTDKNAYPPSDEQKN